MIKLGLFLLSFLLSAISFGTEPNCTPILVLNFEHHELSSFDLDTLSGQSLGTEIFIQNKKLLDQNTSEEILQTREEMKTILEIIKKVKYTFPDLDWPKKLFVIYNSEPGPSFFGGPNSLILSKGLSEIPEETMSFAELMEPIIIHELGHTLVTQSFMKKTGFVQEAEEEVENLFVNNMNTRYFRPINSSFLKSTPDLFQKYIFSFLLQEMSSDLLVSLYYKDHNRLTSHMTRLLKLLPEEERPDHIHKRRGVQFGHSGFGYLETERLKASSLRHEAHNQSLRVRQAMYLGKIQLKSWLAGLSKQEYLRQNPELQQELTENLIASPHEPISPYNYANETRYFLGNKGYFSKAVLEGKEAQLMKIIQDAVVEFSLQTEWDTSLNVASESLKTSMFERIAESNTGLKELIKQKLEDANF